MRATESQKDISKLPPPASLWKCSKLYNPVKLYKYGSYHVWEPKNLYLATHGYFFSSLNKPVVQAADADPSQCNSTNMQKYTNFGYLSFCVVKDSTPQFSKLIW